MRNIFKINIFTYLFFLLYILSGFYKDVIIIYLILFIHELGHYLIMKLNNISVECIIFYPYGGMIKSNMLINTNSIRVLVISLGGILSQLLLTIIFFLLYKLDYIDFNVFNLFKKYNVYIMLFNLLPMYPLDGFKILTSVLEIFFNFKDSIKISLIISSICIIIFLVYLYIYKISNYVIVIFLLVNLINYLKELKYLINKFYIERILYNLEYKGMVSVNDIDFIYKNKLNYINGISEKKLLKSKFKV